MRIRTGDYNVSMLSMEDFGFFDSIDCEHGLRNRQMTRVFIESAYELAKQ